MESGLKKIKRALISVSKKDGILELANELSKRDIEIVSTGGTARLLRENGLAVQDISELTGFPEMLDGRVKTLHPKVHGGLLFIRDNEIHRTQAAAHDILPIDLVIVNLYPFVETISRPGTELEEAIENIDIGGPAMIRSAAKNHNDVVVIVESSSYGQLLEQLEKHEGATTLDFRFRMAAAAFTHTADYDTQISRYLSARLIGDQGSSLLPEQMELGLRRKQALRYGENPHQNAALYSLSGAESDGVANARQLQGKELSYNNLLDADAAWVLAVELVAARRSAGGAECVIIKHTNPCGVGQGKTAAEAFTRAKATDPVSAFGGIIAITTTVDADAARAITELFSEVIIAPAYTEEALAIFAAKKNLRLLEMGEGSLRPASRLELRRISGGLLVQESDLPLLPETDLKVVSQRAPTAEEMEALTFAWAICKHVKSNAIVYAKSGQLVSVGAGQMSRVDSVKLGAGKAHLPVEGSVLASDAFFPFRDGIDEAARYGITAVIQPGGSVQDAQSIEAANEHNLAMVFTGMRHFKH